jgi:(p)ppGpp synthase/HD superfamily hydrolase
MKISKAYNFAKEKHKGQKRRSGEDYFEAHIEKVVHLLKKHPNDKFDIIISAAYLHDVVEDTDVTLDELREQFDKSVCDVVEILTKRENESYFNFIMRIKDSEIKEAILVKLADINQNMSDANEKDKKGSQYAKYQFARHILVTKLLDMIFED